MSTLILYRSRGKSLRRAGIEFTRHGVTLDLSTLTTEQQRAIEDDPGLIGVPVALADRQNEGELTVGDRSAAPYGTLEDHRIDAATGTTQPAGDASGVVSGDPSSLKTSGDDRVDGAIDDQSSTGQDEQHPDAPPATATDAPVLTRAQRRAAARAARDASTTERAQ
ncbi:MAG: hypothetical protein GAK28_00696 [Luteibacter sp.]|uniref:hypothetical protein n=1 Tax=Luteibacter sp. TaxID=1886636 RepID=UPI00137D1B4D|nr:hypothetical protein [Luteibacter sp.]KAF1009063.1 MAG: hypothetical protein GAK28_00696 [Luteibacter sp.]